MIAARERGAQTEDLPGASHAQSQALPRFGTNRQFRPAFAQDKDTARRLSFAEQHGVSRANHIGLYRVKCRERAGGQIAEEAVGTQGAVEATMRYRALHTS